MHPHDPRLADEKVHHNPVVDLVLDCYTGVWVASRRIDTPRRVMEGGGSDLLLQELEPAFIQSAQFPVRYIFL